MSGNGKATEDIINEIDVMLRQSGRPGLPGAGSETVFHTGPGGTPVFNPSNSGLPGANSESDSGSNSPAGSRLALALLPVTPVPLTEWQSWVRLGLYGTAAYLTWPKAKTLSYIAMGAAGLSLATSLASQSWSAKNA